MSQTGNTYARIAKVLGQIFDEVPVQIGPDTSALDIPGWDSLAHVNVVLGLEKEFNVKFTSAEIQDAQNLRQFADLIAKRREKATE